LALGDVGPAPVHDLQRRFGLFGSQGRPGDGVGDSHLDSGHRTGARLPAPFVAAREHHHHRHRRRGRRSRGGRHLHAPGAIHSQARSASRRNRLHLRGRRLPRCAVPDSAAALLRARHARPVALPRGHGDHRSARHRREGRLSGAPAAAGDVHCRSLRFLRQHLPGLERERGLPVPSRHARLHRAHQGGVQLRRHWVHPRSGLRDGPAQLDDPVRRRRSVELRAGAGGLVHRQPPSRYRRVPRLRAHRQDDRGADFPRLRALRGSGRHRHGGNLWDREIAAHRDRLVRDRGARFPARRGSGAGTHGPRYSAHGHAARRGSQRAGGGRDDGASRARSPSSPPAWR